MNKINLVILGATSYRELYDLISDINENNKEEIVVKGLLDDNEELIGKEILDAKVLGPLIMVEELKKGHKFCFAIGSHKTIKNKYQILKSLNLEDENFYSLVHPSVKIFNNTKIHPGVIIHCNSVIFNNTIIYPHTIIMPGVIIGTNNIVGRGCSITGNTCTTNNVKIGSYSFIGTNSTISENSLLGPGSFIGLNSLIHFDTKPGEVRFGNPSRKIKTNEVEEGLLHEWEGIINQKN